MKDRRIHKRTDLVFYLEITDETGGESIGYIGDISDSGLMILSEKQLSMGKIYNIKIKLPSKERALLGENDIAVSVKTKWEKPDYNPKYFCTGCEFLSLHTSNEVIIKKIIASLGFKTLTE